MANEAGIERIGDGNPNGTVLWGSGEKGGFYGIATPIVQPTSSDQAAVTATALGTIDFTSATEAATVVAAVNELKVLANGIRSALVNLNLIAGS